MKRIILFILISLFSNIIVAQDSLIIQELKNYKEEIAIKSGFAIYLHGIAFISFKNSPINDPNTWNNVLIYSSIGLVFDVLAIAKFCKYRNYKRENYIYKISYR